jgi:hypothetical protein
MAQVVAFALTNPASPPGRLTAYGVLGTAVLQPPFVFPFGSDVPVTIGPSNVATGDALTATLSSVVPAGCITLVATDRGFTLSSSAPGSANLHVVNPRTGATLDTTISTAVTRTIVPPVLTGSPLLSPEQSTGTVEIALTRFGGDFAMNTTTNPGDIVPISDTPAAAPATGQRLTVMTYLSPRGFVDGVPTSPDDPWNETYGIGLPRLVDALQTPEAADEIGTRYHNGMATDPGVAPSPDSIGPLPFRPTTQTPGG